MSDELKPCPFCGGTNLSIGTNSVQPDNWHDAYVSCYDCDATGRHAMTLEGWLSSKAEAKEEAVVAWNRRALLAAQPAAATVPDMTILREVVEAAAAIDEFGEDAGCRNRLAEMARKALSSNTPAAQAQDDGEKK